MSNYFNRLPDLEYVSRLKDARISDYITVKNLFKKGIIREDIFQNLSAFEKYKIIKQSFFLFVLLLPFAHISPLSPLSFLDLPCHHEPIYCGLMPFRFRVHHNICFVSIYLDRFPNLSQQGALERPDHSEAEVFRVPNVV